LFLAVIGEVRPRRILFKMLDLHRNLFKGLEDKTADVFARLPLTPNQYTAYSLFGAVAMLCFLISGDYWVALAFFLISAALDFIDGAVARRKKMATKLGAYWDTIADRYVEAILLFGLLFVGLPDFYLPAVAWIFLTLLGSTMTTYAKAAAKEKDLVAAEMKGGLMSRAERLLVYAGIIFLLAVDEATLAVSILTVLAILTNITAVQRIKNALRR